MVEPSVSGLDGSTFVLEPIWRNPGHPDAIAAAEWVFTSPDSLWTRKRSYKEELSPTPLLAVSSFRQVVLDGLVDRSQAGTVELDSKMGSLIVRFPAGGEWTTDNYKGDPLAGRLDVELPFRVCDLFAYYLSKIDGMPQSELYWPQAKRDEAATASASILKTYGNRLEYDPTTVMGSLRDDRSQFAFPALGHPASREDVRRGLAIFSLEGEGERRVVKLPSYPLPASWTALKQYPRQKIFDDPFFGLELPVLTYLRQGLIWQCEEVMMPDGSLQRYYGFAGPSGLTKVRSEEIKILNDKIQNDQ